jgi:hypothetical protein
MRHMGCAYNVLVRKPGGKRLLGRHSHRWNNDDNDEDEDGGGGGGGGFGKYGLDFYSSVYGSLSGSCEHVNEPRVP